MNTPELPDADVAQVPYVPVESRRATLALLNAVGAFESGPKGEWNFVNEHLCAMLGVPASALLGRQWIKLIHPDDVQRAVAEYKQARDTDRSWHHELRFQRHDGSSLPVLIEANPLPDDPRRKGVSYLGIVSDRSKQQQAEAAAEEANEALQTMIAAIDEGVIIHRNGWIVLANDFAARLLGYEHWTDLIGKHGRDLIAPEDAERLTVVAQSGVPAETMATLLRRDGTPIRVSLRGKPISYAGAPARASVLLPLDSPLLQQLMRQRLQAQVDALQQRLALPHSRVELVDGRPTLIAANQAYADLIGRPLSEIPGVLMADVAPPELNVQQWDSYEEMLRTGTRPPTFDVTYRRPDGSLVHARVYAVDYPDPVTGKFSSMSFVVPM